MTWQPIETAPDAETVILYSPAMDRDESFPGHPFVISNPHFVRKGNAKKQGFTHWMPMPKAPEVGQ